MSGHTATLRRLLASILTVALASWPALADDELSAEAQKDFDGGMAYARDGDWEFAQRNFEWALNALGDEGKFNPPPGLVFNLALAHDRRPGRQLAAAIWYEGFLALAPESDIADSVRQRITVLLREFDAMQTAKVDLTHKVFEDLLEVHRERAAATGNSTDPDIRGILQNDLLNIETAVQNAASALIYMDRVSEGLSFLSEFNLRDRVSDAIMISLMSVGRLQEARAYATDSDEFEEAQRIIGSIADLTAATCRDQSRFRAVHWLADVVEARYMVGNYGEDIETPDGIADLADNSDREHVFASKYVEYTHSLQAVGQIRWHYRTLRDVCG